MLFKLLISTMIFSLVACSSSKETTQKNIYKASETVTMDRFLQDAISQGLKRDAITVELASNIASIDKFFVQKCNICKNVRKALQEHQGYTDASKMKGQVKWIQKVTQEDKKAFKTFVNSYVQTHFENSGLSKAQKAALHKEIGEEAEKGKMLITVYSFCPSCDGAKECEIQ